MKTYLLDGQNLSIEDVVAVAHANPTTMRFELTAEAGRRVALARQAIEVFAKRRQVVYGITTGFGAFCDRVIDPAQTTQLQHNIVMSHAVGVGAPLETPVVRAMMLIRANTLAKGHSGCRIELIDLLLRLLERGVHPLIPRQGSLGASGDLAPLAHMALVMIGLGEAEFQGQILPGSEALAAAGLTPMQLQAKEGLALTNGTALMAALGALAVDEAENAACVADVAGALSLEALHGTTTAFDARLQSVRPHPRAVECAAHLRQLLVGSSFVRQAEIDVQAPLSGVSREPQDAYTLRCIPQVHGACHDAIKYARWVVEIELNAATDNPLIFVDEETGQADVISGGNFHGEPLAIAYDYLALALTELGNISERRLSRLTDGASNRHVLPDFLTRDGGLNSGFMLVQYTAAALASENKSLSHPASADTIPTSANWEDHVSNGPIAARQARRVLRNVETILAIELLAAAQGIDLRGESVADAHLGLGTAIAYDLIRREVPFLEQDDVMYPHIEAVRCLVVQGTLREAVARVLSCSYEL